MNSTDTMNINRIGLSVIVLLIKFVYQMKFITNSIPGITQENIINKLINNYMKMNITIILCFGFPQVN